MVEKTETTESPRCKALLETGRKLFWKHGFRRVSVDEICRDAGISKMTFYRCFESKTDLARRIYKNLVSDGVLQFTKILEDDTPPTEKLRQILLFKAESTNNISAEFMTDFYNSPDTGLKEFVEEVTRETWMELIKSFRSAQEKGHFRKDFRPEFLLYISQHLAPLMMDENLVKLYGSTQEVIMEFANFFTYGIAPHD